GSGWREYRSVVEDTDRHGNVRIYFRLKGQPKVRMAETPGTPAFEEEYQRARNGDLTVPPIHQSARAPAAPGTMHWLCQQYYASAAFLALGESTRKVRRGLLDDICERAGAYRYTAMEPQHVAKLRDEKAQFPEAANARVKALRQLFKWACSKEYRYATKNPAVDVEYLKSKNPDGFKAWTEEDLAKYEARHPIGTKARLALDLLLYTGVRRSDVVRLGPQMERWCTETLDDGTEINVQKLVFTEMKGRERTIKTHELPILPPLRASIDAAPIGNLVYLVTAFGRPHSVKAFGNWFKRRCREAGIDEAQKAAHGLRKLGAQRCADAGATEHQLMALFGWTTTKQAALYTRKANRFRLEAAAAPLLQGHKRNESVPPFPMVSSSGTKTPKKD
ncbi:MAG: tyrosine-type recombinase/integrase, partial [Alphaproteobacteria bacterium]|nr:tyrosine-type recombinase/integrase [Alphaproteobacteria bacterium]